MASIKKFTHAAVVNEIRHIRREIVNDFNKDIDRSRSHLNYSLTPEHPLITDTKRKTLRKMTDYEYYKNRKKELYCYNRSDVKTMAGWVITAPSDLAKEDERAFFLSVYSFLAQLYGVANIISVYIHYDEAGRPHMHFYFIPVVVDKRHAQGFKICANELLTRNHLQHFHPDLEQYLRKDGIHCTIRSGITKAQGRNYTVEELKISNELKLELERLYEIERKYNLHHSLDYNIGGTTW